MGRQARTDRYYVHIAVGHSLGNAAPENGLRLRYDLLASPAYLAKAGVWTRLHRTLLAKLRGADQLDFSRVIADSSSVRAVHGEKTGPNPTNRRKVGSKHHILVDAQGVPVNVIPPKARQKVWRPSRVSGGVHFAHQSGCKPTMPTTVLRIGRL